MATGLPFLYCGKNLILANVGISFSPTVTEPAGFTGGVTNFVQVINNATVTDTSSNPTNSTLYPVTSGTSGNDSVNPTCFYGFNAGSSGCSDSPDTLCLTTNTSVYENFNATMYLMWQPPLTAVNGDNVVWVPLRSVPWNWNATATNIASTNNGSGWLLANTNYPQNTNDYSATNEPIWNQNAQSSWHSGPGP